MLSVELEHLSDVLDSVGVLKNVSSQAKEWSSRIRKAIWDTTVSVPPWMMRHDILTTYTGR